MSKPVLYVKLSAEEFAYFEQKRSAEAARQGRHLTGANYIRTALNALWAEEDGDEAFLCTLQETGRPRIHSIDSPEGRRRTKKTPTPCGSPSPQPIRAGGGT